MKKQHVAFAISWTESEAGWGQRSDGYSLHESQEDATAYIKEYWKREKQYNLDNGIVGTPECYSREDSDRAQITVISAKAAKTLREATAAGKHGVRYWKAADFAPKKEPAKKKAPKNKVRRVVKKPTSPTLTLPKGV